MNTFGWCCGVVSIVMRNFLAVPNATPILPSTTQSPMLASLPRLTHSFTVTVGPKRSGARYFLDSVSEVHGLLRALADDDTASRGGSTL